MPANTRFSDRVAVVTGAASGIGRATAERLAYEGASVACLDRHASLLEETVVGIGAAGVGAALAVACDVSDPAAVEEAFQAAEAAFGMPDVVCNVAGIGGFSHSHATTDDDWHRMISVNLTGTFFVCRAALRRWWPLVEENPKRYRRRPGREFLPRPAIVNVASSAGIMGQPYSAAYCASKGGVIQLTKALAVEYVEVGFRVNAVAPGGVDTPLIASFMPPEDASPKLVERMVSPFGFAPPSDIAGVIAFLASDDASTMTGSVVPVDGGLTA